MPDQILSRKRVLLLEDNADDAELLAIELESAGLDVELQRVSCERDFRESLASFAPDVVISDFNLPGFSGLQALDLVRSCVPDTPFIFVTGTDEDHPDTVLARQRAEGWLTKNDIGAVPGLLSSVFRRQA